MAPSTGSCPRPVALHPQAQAALDIVAGAGIPAVEELTPQQAREAFRKSVALCGAPGEPVARVEERAVEGAAGSIPVRVYGPDAPAPRPVLVYFHGGGWVVGDLDTVDSPLRALANRSGATIVSVDYRLAPEHPYPAALEDCFAATEWAAAHAGDIGGARGRVAIGGDSAGGNLALAVALAARAGGAPDIGYQVLLYPVADHDFATTSYRDNAEGYGLTRAGMKWYWDHYVLDPQLRDDPLVSPLRAKDLSRLPPARSSRPSTTPCATKARLWPPVCSSPGSRSSTSTTTA